MLVQKAPQCILNIGDRECCPRNPNWIESTQLARYTPWFLSRFSTCEGGLCCCARACAQVEEYGAQPPIELLRQLMDHSGWYDRKELTFRKIVDVQFLASMGPPGGGRNNVTNRYLRHYSVMSVVEFSQESLLRIFSTLAEWMFKRNEYDASITKYKNPMVSATIDIYDRVQESLLPTPMKSHYTFNLRDISKVRAPSLGGTLALRGTMSARGRHAEDGRCDC